MLYGEKKGRGKKGTRFAKGRARWEVEVLNRVVRGDLNERIQFESKLARGEGSQKVPRGYQRTF